MPKNELPADLDPEELNKMIAALARELGCPHGVHPDLVELGEIPQYVYGYNRGCVPDGLTLYRQGQKWRRRLIKEITPEFVEEFRAAKWLDERIRELCEAKGLTFRP
jgi:hypothetical protein